jgi:hypothetical protein
MRSENYLRSVMAVYQGEVFGEALFSGLLERAAPQHQPLFSAMLQMETEAKARLRPFLIRLGLSIAEDEDMRRRGCADAARLGALGWREFLATFVAEIAVYVDRYQAIADAAPAEDREALEFMVEHERKFMRCAAAALVGRNDHALEAVASELLFRPDAPAPAKTA